MQKIAIAEDRKIFADRSAYFRGRIRVQLQHLDFKEPSPRSKSESDRARDILATRFEKGGCYRLVPSHYIPAIVNQDALNLILQCLKLSAEELVDYAGKEPPEPTLPRDFRLRCLKGRIRTEACKIALPAADRWWNVDLYLSDAGTELRNALIEEYSGSINYSDSAIFNMICHYRRQGLERNKFAEKRWWLRLTPNKINDLKLFLNHELASAFNDLQAIPGLWTGNWIGVLHHVLALKCDERLRHYLENILATWKDIVGGNENLMKLIDSETIAALELRAPSFSRERLYLRALFEEGLLFKAITDKESRENIWRNLTTIQGLIPTLHTFFEDVKYLGPPAKVMKGLLGEAFQGTVDAALENCFSGINQTEGHFRLQRSENKLLWVQGSVADQVQFGNLTLWLFAMRYCFEMAGECPRKDRGSKKPVAKEPNDALWYSLALLALELGYDSDRIREL
ncbi:hypothetical protein K432DRAFT_311912, partial [Lepidopterella palustris CBS 459.81]